MSNPNCRCDALCTDPLTIPAGLDLPRQIAGFPEFRRAMLATFPLHSPCMPGAPATAVTSG